MEFVAIVIIGLIALMVLLLKKLFESTAPSRERAENTASLVKYAYSVKAQIMTNAEKVFYDKLLAEAGDEYYIVPQAHLSMFINHKIKGQNWRGAFSVINGKSVDFLIVEKTTQKPALAIELDDYTHGRPDRQRRDQIVEEILNRAGVPLQRYANNEQIPTFRATLQGESDGKVVAS